MRVQPGLGELRDPQQQTGDTHLPVQIAQASPRRWARIAGLLYLINIVFGAFTVGYVPAAIVVPGDAAATAHNILAHELLYRLSLAAHLITVACNIPLAVIFFDLFKVVNRRFALLVVFFILVGTAVEGANLLNQFSPLTLLGGGRYMSAFTPEQVQAMVYMSFDSQAISYNIQQVLYAGYLLAAGYLIFSSIFLPRLLGVLLAIGGACYLTYSFADVLAPAFAALLVPYVQVPSGVAELSLCLWLLVIGVKVQRWKEQASASAAA
jgi:Domain of unknown function (DUF4386)